MSLLSITRIFQHALTMTKSSSWLLILLQALRANHSTRERPRMKENQLRLVKMQNTDSFQNRDLRMCLDQAWEVMRIHWIIPMSIILLLIRRCEEICLMLCIWSLASIMLTMITKASYQESQTNNNKERIHQNSTSTRMWSITQTLWRFKAQLLCPSFRVFWLRGLGRL